MNHRAQARMRLGDQISGDRGFQETLELSDGRIARDSLVAARARAIALHRRDRSLFQQIRDAESSR